MNYTPIPCSFCHQPVTYVDEAGFCKKCVCPEGKTWKASNEAREEILKEVRDKTWKPYATTRGIPDWLKEYWKKAVSK